MLRFLHPLSWILAVCLSAGCAWWISVRGPGDANALSPQARLGERAFHDPGLSASGALSCASCHAPQTGHHAPNALAVQWGGADMRVQGARASQSVRYLATHPAFRLDADGKPSGGLFWDGRADSLAHQAAGPLLGAAEMANADKAALAARIVRTAWAADFERVYGAGVWQDPERAFDALTDALQRYQAEDRTLNGFTSKYDAVLRGRARLSLREARGLAIFEAEDKGNCAACHPSGRGADGSHPLFTDFSYDNLGVPRNPEIAANADPAHFDLGLCAREELKHREDLCGAFRVPSLRNVALRKVFFHNGRFKSLKEAIVFYVQRDTHPEKWYPRLADGTVHKFDDLPPRLHAAVNTREAPYDRKPGDEPALSDAQIDDLIAFLNTLTDGWQRR